MVDATKAIDMGETLMPRVIEGCESKGVQGDARGNLYMTLGNLATEGISARGSLMPLLSETLMGMMQADATQFEHQST